jgi:hypothetical protein
LEEEIDMRAILRALPLVGFGLILGADRLWAHPGHHALEGIRSWVAHALSSPYHVGWIALAAVCVGWVVWSRRARRAVRDR